MTSNHDVYEVVVIVGSENDLKEVGESGTTKVLDEVLGGRQYWASSVVSADRNDEELVLYCTEQCENGTLVFIAIAGLTNVLGGRIAQIIKYQRPVIAVGRGVEPIGQLASLLSVTQVPKGKLVLTTGIGQSAMYNAALAACQIVGLMHPVIRKRLAAFLTANNKPAKIGVDLTTPKEA